jgi:hypothetical protein
MPLILPNKIKLSKASNKSQNLGTVESKHKEQLAYFEQRHNQLPTLIQQLDDLNLKLKNTNDDIQQRELTQEITQLQSDIHNIQNNNDEFKYLLNAGPILFKYHDHLNNPNSSKSINRFELLDEYKAITDQNWVKKSKSNKEKMLHESICSTCNVLMHLNYQESTYICPECAIQYTTFIDSDRPSYKDPPPEVNYFAYKRINHFNELLAQFQAKESTHIPQDVFDTIKTELRKERKCVKDLSYDLVKKYLKKHADKKYNQYYDHIFHIINRLNGSKPRNMTPEMEERFRYLFLKIQEPFDKYCPEDRKNFISYNFVFYKFCELLGYTEFLQYFPLLKSKDKLYEQEKIWEKICNDIGIGLTDNIPPKTKN